MNPKIALWIIFFITTFIQQSFGEGASGNFCFEVTDEGISCHLRFTEGFMPIGMPLPMILAYYYAVQPGVFPSAKMMKFPLVVGKQWSGRVGLGGVANWIGKTTVRSSTKIVTVPAGTFKNCLMLKTEIKPAADDPPTDFMSGTRFIWFAPGLGLIKVKYYHGNGKVTNILLKEYVIGRKMEEDDYFPLNKGMEWKYEWHNGYYGVIVDEECYATGKKEQGCLPILCKNELSKRTVKGWPPEFPIFEGIDSRDKLSMTWGYIKRTK
jgi:hypothetical protein